MNILRIDIDPEVLATGAFGAGALVRVERSATGGGAGFAEIGTLAVVATDLAATYYDTTGTTTHWYRTRYSDAAGAVLSEYGPEFQVGGPLPYTNYGAVKARLGITDTTDDDILQVLCEQVNQWLEGRLGRRVGPENGVTYTFDGNGLTRLRVIRGIRAVTALTVASTTGATPVAATAADIFLLPPTGDRAPGQPADWIVLSDHPTGSVWYFPVGYGNVRVTGDFGFASIPDDLADIATTCVVSKYRARASAGGDTFTIGVEGERTFERLLSYEDKLTLRRYAVGPLVA
jgi:hypothetical protein